MISATPQPPFDEWVAAIEQQLRAATEAQAQNASLARGADPMRWRRPSLLWPTFTKG